MTVPDVRRQQEEREKSDPNPVQRTSLAVAGGSRRYTSDVYRLRDSIRRDPSAWEGPRQELLAQGEPRGIKRNQETENGSEGPRERQKRPKIILRTAKNGPNSSLDTAHRSGPSA